MSKKFFTVVVDSQKYRVLFDDLQLIFKRKRKTRPSQPPFAPPPKSPPHQRQKTESSLLEEDSTTEMQVEK